MESGSEGESNKITNSSPAEGFQKPKRQMKTPFQLETLERTYAAEMYPSEAIRAELSEKLGLSDRQLQMWFCHRRLKDKKEASGKKAPAAPVAKKGLFSSSRDDVKVEEPASDGGFGSRSRSGSGSGSDSSQYEGDLPLVQRRYDMSSGDMMKQRVVECVEMQLGEPLRGDGPVLGMEFDEVPPGAFGEPISAAATKEHWGRSGNSPEGKMIERSKPKKIKAGSRSLVEPAEPSSGADAYRKSPSHFYSLPGDDSMKRSQFVQGSGQLSWEYGAQVHPTSSSPLTRRVKQEQYSSPPKNNSSDCNMEDGYQIGRKRKIDEGRLEKEVSDEKRIRKEFEKQDLLRRKREEQMRKEMERQDRERRKEEERMLREKMRMEEKYQREEKRESERREKFLQKELLKAERMKQKEELRREKEAAREKAAMMKAALRRIAKESLELIEDERLELMELAASKKGLPSIISIDYETLQNLESYRDSLCAFPPKAVQLKRPFSIQPWSHSEDNIGNLLMVWRFCITFADVLGLWPFTLDEFVQALHDYDSRLLAEIHIALLKLIVRDIEEGARTPNGGAGTNQYTVANPEGGHPQIVEGAFLWGFDIRSWQNHLNPLTWPEILRQFALSAGFGPQLRKESTEQAQMCDNEAKGCEDIVKMLRNGSAVEHAVSVMQEKRSSLQRRSRHRLTPGTVKFAAYHVLCLEGSKGQTVLELAEKIQKSGLRDLSTSKTPDASISVALSRDPILFERIAPSTYCVRPAFRKDPSNAESILAAAREKIQKFSNGFLVEETVDDVEKDDESESDVGEGPEFDELGTPSIVNKDGDRYNEPGPLSENATDISSDNIALNLRNDLVATGNPTNEEHISGKDVTASDPALGVTEIDESKYGEEWVQGLTEGEYCDLCVEDRLSALVAIIGVANEGNIIRAVLEDRLDAANALKKQTWAESQLDKRRMKDEYLSKFHDPCHTDAADGSYSPLGVTESKKNEVAFDNVIKEEPLVSLDNIQKDQNNFSGITSEMNSVVLNSSVNQNNLAIQQNGSTSERLRLQLKSFISHRAEEMHVYRSLPLGQDRRHNRYWQFVASASRHDPGSARIFVELRDGYWRVIDSAEAFDTLMLSLDTRGIRESHLHIMLQQSQTSFKENIRNLQSFNIFGVKGSSAEDEAITMADSSVHHAGSKRPSSTVCDSVTNMLETCVSFRVDLGKNEIEKMNAYKRYQVLQSWMWKECFNSSALSARRNGRKGFRPLLGICEFCLDSFIFEENKCPSCQRTFCTLGDRLKYMESAIEYEENRKVNPQKLIASDFSLPLQIRLIRALLSFIEVSVPPEAFQSSWTCDHRRNWGLKLQSATSIGDLLQILTQFEGVIKQDCLSSNYETTAELLGSCALSGKIVKEYDPESVPQLPWVPLTTAAVALRLLELDSSIFYTPHQKATETQNMREAENFTKLSARSAYMKDVRKVESTELPQVQDEFRKSRNIGVVTSRASSGKQVIRSRGGARPRAKSQKKTPGSRSEPGRGSIKVKKPPTHVVMQREENTNVQREGKEQGQGRGQEHGHGHRRGPRTVRRRRESNTVEESLFGQFGDHSGLVIRESTANSKELEWVGEELRTMQNEDPDDTEESESDENAETTRYMDRRWEHDYKVASHRTTWDRMEMSDEDADADGVDINGFEEDTENIEQDVDMNFASFGNNLEKDVGMNDASIGNNDDESSETSGDYSD